MIACCATSSDCKASRQGYFYGNIGHLYTSSFCLTETLSVFKRKSQRGNITKGEYVEYIEDFIGRIVGSHLSVEDEIRILNPDLRSEARRLFEKYGIDFIDSMQIVTLLRGKYRHFAGASKSVLVTADGGLAEAARAEKARVWLCTKEAPPKDE